MVLDSSQKKRKKTEKMKEKMEKERRRASLELDPLFLSSLGMLLEMEAETEPGEFPPLKMLELGRTSDVLQKGISA